MKMHVQVFNPEQKKRIAVSEAATQIEKNKTLQLQAEAKGKAILEEQQGVAGGIKLIADARTYELEKIREHGEIYIRLQQCKSTSLAMNGGTDATARAVTLVNQVY